MLGVAALVAIAPLSVAAAAAKVSPDAYAATVCGAVQTLYSDTLASLSSFQQVAQAFRAQPTPATATAARQALVELLQATHRGINAVATAAKTAGSPTGKNGAHFAKALVGLLRDDAAEFGPLEQQASAIDVTSNVRFTDAVQALLTKLQTTSDTAKRLALNESAFRKVSPALRPIVVYMTTDATTCSDSSKSA